MKKTFIFCLFVILARGFITAQVINPVSWDLSVRSIDSENVRLIFKARISSPWHMYGLNIPDGGPIPTSIHFQDTTGFIISGRPQQTPDPEIVDDPIFSMKLELHSKEVTFSQLIRKTSSDSIFVSGMLEYMTCSDMQCVLGDHDFVFRLPGLDETVAATYGLDEVYGNESGESTETTTTGGDSATEETGRGTEVTSVLTQISENSSSGSLLAILLLSILAGFGGLLTPCVYPMIPMTVSYFLRDTRSRSKAISQAVVFGASMVLIYTLIGVAVALLKNPNSINNITTHWAVNLIFFLIFIVLAASFFGMFEIILPAGLANKVDKQADKG
ncbi:MAG: hypothetical protein JXA61_09120, partial [Bacteroidales bacterium]|nr:hypothetical protein [Bacteroidales bacterium]